MKKLFFSIIAILSICYNTTFGQSLSDTIQIKKRVGTVFIQNGEPLTPKRLLAITTINPTAYQEMKIAKTNYDIGTAFSFAGGFLVGWPLGTALGGGDPIWALVGVGAGLIALSIPFGTAYTQHAKKAVNLYNNDLHKTASRNVDFNFGLTANGIGLNIAF